MAKGAFVWDQSGIRIIGMMKVSVRLAALPIPEYLDFHSGYSATRSRKAGIYSRIYSYSRIFPNERALSHRRTGNFLPGGGGGEPFAQKILASCPNFY